MSTSAALAEQVVNVRRDARRIVRTDCPVSERLLAMLDLAARVRTEEDRETRSWCERALYEEARPLLDDVPPGVSGDAYERRQRQLYSEGHAVCPRCLSPVATVAHFARWRTQRDARIVELEIRERAVPAEHPS